MDTKGTDHVGSTGMGGGNPADSSIYTPPPQSSYLPIILAVVAYFWIL